MIKTTTSTSISVKPEKLHERSVGRVRTFETVKNMDVFHDVFTAFSKVPSRWKLRRSGRPFIAR